jgi:hypothetical protein
VASSILRSQNLTLIKFHAALGTLINWFNDGLYWLAFCHGKRRICQLSERCTVYGVHSRNKLRESSVTSTLGAGVTRIGATGSIHLTMACANFCVHTVHLILSHQCCNARGQTFKSGQHYFYQLLHLGSQLKRLSTNLAPRQWKNIWPQCWPPYLRSIGFYLWQRTHCYQRGRETTTIVSSSPCNRRHKTRQNFLSNRKSHVPPKSIHKTSTKGPMTFLMSSRSQ